MELESAVGIATGYGLDDKVDRYSQEFSLLHVVQPASGAYPASCPMGMWRSSAGRGEATGECN
jgi:hypothetical protein